MVTIHVNLYWVIPLWILGTVIASLLTAIVKDLWKWWSK